MVYPARKRIVSLNASILIALVLILTACGGNSSGETGVRVGYPAPDFQLKDYQGNLVNLSDFKGKPILINFWATWCPPCQIEMPGIAEIYRQYQKDDLVVLGVNDREEASTVKKYVEAAGYSWQMLLDHDGNLKVNYQVVGLPTTFFIDRSGVIRFIEVGGLDKQGLEDKLPTILTV
jgi:peroxiredoxin